MVAPWSALGPVIPGFGAENPVNPWTKKHNRELLDPSSHPWGPVMAQQVRKADRKKRSLHWKVSKLHIIQTDDVVGLSRFCPGGGRICNGIQNVSPL